MKFVLWMFGLLGGLVVAIAGYALLTSRVDPVAWLPAPNPGLRGAFAPNEKLGRAHLIIREAGAGPEDITRGTDGWFYTAFRDGRIVKFRSTGAYENVVSTGGFPLGLRVDSEGNLIVADAERGLLRVAPDRTIRVLVDAVGGKKLTFADGVDIASDGTIWFTDASARFGHGENIYIFLEARADGRLLSYAPDTGSTTVHLDNLFFANGVAVAPDGEYVLVSETGAGRIRRLWVKGARAGSDDVFHPGLPGAPDNLSIDALGIVWVALAGLRSPEFETLADKPLVRKLLGALPPSALAPKPGRGVIVGLDSTGTVVYNLQAADNPFGTITSASRWGNALYIGSLGTNGVGILDIDD